MASIASQRRTAIKAVKRIMEPRMYDSGYIIVIDPAKSRFSAYNSRPVRLWADPEKRLHTLWGAYKLIEFMAITEFGPMTDGFGGGMVWEPYHAFPLEDLLKLRAWAERTFDKKALPITGSPKDFREQRA